MDIDYDINDNSDCDDDCSPDELNSYYEKLEASALHTNSRYPYPEQKILDVGSAGTLTWQSNSTFVTAGSSYCINDDITSGTNINQMTGNQVSTKSVSWNFYPAFGSATAPTIARLCLVWDRQPNGATASYADIFAVDVPSANNNVYAHQNPDNRQRFIILKKWCYPSPLNGTTNYESGKLLINMTTTYNDLDVVAPTPIRTGALLFVGASVTGSLTVSGRFRIRYYDN